MKLINPRHVPDIIFKWLQQDFYDSADAAGTTSVTTLIKPIQETILKKRYDDVIEIDCTTRVWSLLGSGVHAVLEKIEDEDIVPVERLKFQLREGWLSGKFDLVRKKKNKVTDFKVTSAWTAVYGSKVEDWVYQLSCYRYLYWKCKKVMLSDVGSIIGIFRDWQRNKLDTTDYPECPIVEMNLKLLPVEQTEQWIRRRLKLITAAGKLKDKYLPACNEKERMFDKKTYRSNKCELYCDAAQFCPQFARAKRVV